MGELIPFKKKEKLLGNGPAHCMVCDYEWHADVEIGAIWLKCPNCHSDKGLLNFPYIYNQLHFSCGCGNNLFHISPDSFYCPNCGFSFLR